MYAIAQLVVRVPQKLTCNAQLFLQVEEEYERRAELESQAIPPLEPIATGEPSAPSLSRNNTTSGSNGTGRRRGGSISVTRFGEVCLLLSRLIRCSLANMEPTPVWYRSYRQATGKTRRSLITHLACLFTKLRKPYVSCQSPSMKS